ncbi:hypothetical protein BDF20DRAFT_899773 [Mycotypha africana]|uniref:uncharacterized protein n=1 Tax=Mycotypha africana TaxID=64632 RepID=UPI00230121FF|nr:uncharacterized protein BDF20DRAFT_899773 [Mycotypha africana]KAI8967527.1 hypothetical protein BDF20DRAFT_899773 [Mycotypha africana]
MRTICEYLSVLRLPYNIMQAHENVVKKLNEEFKKVDKAFRESDMRVFGEDSSELFQQLNALRRKQIDIASDHVSLDSTCDLHSTQLNKVTSIAKDTEKQQIPHQQQDRTALAKSFERKEAMLKNMMHKLDDLTQTMDKFKEIAQSRHEEIMNGGRNAKH